MLESNLLSIPREVPCKRPIQVATITLEREIAGIEDIAVVAESLCGCFANELLVLGALEILIMGRKDNDDVLLWVCGRHCTKLLLRPAVAEIFVVGVAADKAADAADEPSDGARGKARHFWRKWKLEMEGV